MTRRMGWCVALVALALAPMACGGGGSESAAPPADESESAVEPGAAEEAAEATEGVGDADEAMDAEGEVPASGDFGVAACDAFFTKYFACIDANVPEAGRDAARMAAEQTKQGLKRAAEAQGGAEALNDACLQAQETAEQAMAAYDCEW
jgi:hypothetical protein